MDDAQRFDQSRYKHWIEDQVRFSDLDPLGHVNNNAIGQFFENSRAAFFLKVTPTWPHCQQLFILARIAIDFRNELHYPAPIRIGTGVTRVGNTSMHLCGAVFKGDVGIAYCESVSVLIDNKTRKPIPVPTELRETLKKYEA
ncbi:MAG TPA: thioesterase family protein [Alphaproteobacteria bacterium]|nr:thioesterase family protein [Alphaproteobacteria bacterium]